MPHPATPSPITVTWHDTPATLPPEDTAPATPFHSRAWATAWQHVTTEPIITRRHLHLDDGAQGHHLALHLMDTSPLWTWIERDAGTTARWGGPVLFAPSLYGEYGGLPAAGPAVLAAAVDHARTLATSLGAAALVVPNLDQHELPRWYAARRPDTTVRLYWAHRAEVGNGLEDFVARIPTSPRRTEFRRQHRRGTEAGLTLHVARGNELRGVLAEFTSQAQATSARHGNSFYGADMFAHISQVPGATALLAMAADGTLAGGFLGFVHNQVLYLWTAAIDQARKRELHTYGWLMAESVAFAAAQGAHTIDVGRGNYLYKIRLGLDPQPLTAAVYLTQPRPALLERLQAMDAGLIANVDRAWRGR